MATTRDPVVSSNGRRAEILETLEDWLELDRRGDDRPTVEMPCPEFGFVDGKPRTILLRAMDDRQRDDYELRFIGSRPYVADAKKAAQLDQEVTPTYRDRLAGNRVELLVRCIVNSAGEAYLSHAQVDLLARRNAAVTARLYARARELCGFETEEERAEAAKKDSAPHEPEPPSD